MRADECCPPLGDARGGREADVVHTIVAMLDLSRGDLLELGRAAQSRHYSSREHTIFTVICNCGSLASALHGLQCTVSPAGFSETIRTERLLLFARHLHPVTQ